MRQRGFLWGKDNSEMAFIAINVITYIRLNKKSSKYVNNEKESELESSLLQ